VRGSSTSASRKFIVADFLGAFVVMVVDLLHFNEVNTGVALDFVTRSPASIEPNRALSTSISLQGFVVVPGSLPRFFKTVELDVVDPSPELLEHRCGLEGLSWRRQRARHG
jgi:hypothetical protein